MHIVLNLFEKCNLQCKYCYKNDIAGFTKLDLKPMSFETIDSILKKAVSEFDDLTVNITGGEPLLDKELVLQILKSISIYGNGVKKTTITSNGTLFSKEFARLVNSIHPTIEIDITIDGPPSIHNLQRPGKKDKDSHSLALHGIENALSQGLKVTLNSVISKNQVNFGSLAYYEYMNSLGVPWIFGKAITGDSSLKLSEKEFNNFAIAILDHWASDESYSTDKPNTLIDSLILKALEKIPESPTERCANSLLSFAGNSGLAWPCTKLIPYKDFCLGSFLDDGKQTILDHDLRGTIFNLFQNDNTCAHEALIEEGVLVPLPDIAFERKKFSDFLRKAITE